MSTLRAEFYADDEDLVLLLDEFSKIGSFEYREMVSQLNQDNACYMSASLLIDKNRICSFLVTDTEKEIISRTITMSDGSGYKRKIDQGFNIDSVCLKLGGDIGDNTIIAGGVDTLGESARAKEIYKLFKKAIIKNTAKVGRSRVMKNALTKLKAGCRLTPCETYSRNQDVKL